MKVLCWIQKRISDGKGDLSKYRETKKPTQEDKKLDNKTKVSIFNTMISSVFLYNSEI